MLSPRASSLFHFTKGGMTALKSILKNYFFPNYSLEDLSWQSNSGNLRIAFPLVSFCDIPISRIKEHLRFYGSWGLGMDRNWGLMNKICPVLYVVQDSPFVKSFNSAFKGAIKMKTEYKESAYLDSMRQLSAFIKPLSGMAITIDGKKEEKKFYHESEWRFIPTSKELRPYLKEEEYEDSVKYNSLIEKAALKFHPNAIRYIFVKSEFDLLELIDFIYYELTELEENRKKQLLTRIISIEDLQDDI